ncbi:hypothetical protein [Streptomyces sp. NRRL WC-3725]|uniref:hypothetical protein n=1 Tax=Streptomyces sp. NRRL WC-3725 TaxID=1463933 RepID=UPI000AFF1768|nr:hypothetical protein [Streptomyces sp. NRRL WC-3725]
MPPGAVGTRSVRADRAATTAQEVLALVGALPTTLVRDPATGAPYLDIVLAGLRTP